MFKKCIRNFSTKKFPLKYGLNPSNKMAGYYFKNSPTFQVINGNPSYINILDAMLGWNLVNDIKITLNKKAATSFKHNAPAGVAICDTQHSALFKARNCDKLSSYGDFIAVNGIVDKKCAEYLKNQVSDGIIAEDYTMDAIKILTKKKKQNYIILKGLESKNRKNQINHRDHFGVTLFQSSSNSIDFEFLKDLNKEKALDAALGWITLQYTPSNSVNLTVNGQVIGIGAGQQNRLECIHLAGKKSKEWCYRNIKKKVKYTMCSDGFLPFTDNIDAAQLYNVDLILHPGGSINDKKVDALGVKKNIEIIKTNQRAFYH